MSESRRRRMAARAVGIKMDPPKSEHLRLVEAFLTIDQRKRMLSRMEKSKCDSEMVFVSSAINFLLDALDVQEKQQERKSALVMTFDEWQAEQAALRTVQRGSDGR